MKKIILPEPFASLILCGALDSIPNYWKDTHLKEKIFIYAKGIHEDFQGVFNSLNSYHRKVYNEMFFGNLQDILDEEGKFIGYVQVKKLESGKIDWMESEYDILKIGNNYKFSVPVHDFCKDYSKLEKIKGGNVKLKRMRISGNKLFIPVGLETWKQINANIGCANLCISYEEYMDQLSPSFRIFENYDTKNEITEVYFERNGKFVKFESSGVSQSFISKKEWKGELIYILNFNLEYQDFGNYVIPTNTDLFNPKDYDNQMKSSYIGNDKWSPFYPGEATIKSLRTISLPMGGMTQWKRK